MKTVIIYESTHHGNTYKLVEAIAKKHSVDTINVENTNTADLAEYDLIGFAAGIAFGKFYKNISAFAEKCLPEGKKVFLMYTCGKNSEKYTSSMKELAEIKNCEVAGCYSCPGYDTFGPFKLIGGINRNHPTETEIAGAVSFFEKLI